MSAYGEPWRIDRSNFCDDQIDGIDGGGDTIMEYAGCGTHQMRIRPEHAARLIACVNALAGMEPSALAGLVAAAEYVKRQLTDAALVCRLEPNPNTEAMTVYQSLADNLRAALSALRGGK